MKKNIAVLGSTGSIGTQSLEVIQSLGCHATAITGYRNVPLLETQARRYRPCLAAVYDEGAAADLKIRLADTDTRVVSGLGGLIEAATLPETETVVTAVVGMVGLRPTLAAIEAGKRIALANKETLVCAGDLVMAAAKTCNAEILPVDSEHSAIFQCLRGKRSEIRRLILTASGGPFRGKRYEDLSDVKKEDALRHPNWRMGAKITIDSATMMNKGLELIEAMHLFDVPREKIEILIHPQSIIHSMVEYRDCSVLAQMGVPDMRVPIQLALTWPAREISPAQALNFTQMGSLTFEPPDLKTFPCLALAMEVAGMGGTAAAVMNAANEEAVALFLQDKIGFHDIFHLVSGAVRRIGCRSDSGLEQILEADREARALVRSGKVTDICIF